MDSTLVNTDRVTLEKEGLDYIHTNAIHGLTGPAAIIHRLLQSTNITSVIDVGCGTGTWIRACMDRGIRDCVGVDGMDLLPDQLHFSKTQFKQVDLRQSWDLHRKFDLAICVEVAEHLDQKFESNLLDCLTRHADTVLFSAACPGQPGQHHVNCQWPSYWQSLFNNRGFVCADAIRWSIWEDNHIECWYRQNIFIARRSSMSAGTETRILPVVHPEMASTLFHHVACADYDKMITEGKVDLTFYRDSILKGLIKKVWRKFSGCRF